MFCEVHFSWRQEVLALACKMIKILMTSYNGEKYIAEQIESLLSQTEQRFKVIVSDDGSTDSTWDILTGYTEKYPEKFFIFKNNPPHGAKYNFLNLMICYKDDYLMLCDQDDVWLDNKIENELNAMLELEANFGRNMPLLVHTDLRVVDSELNSICDSFKEMMNANYARVSLKDQIIQNTLTGCTAMYNRALANMITAQPNFCVMHDWWLMLTAAAFGRIFPLDERDILYRQHYDNEIGAKHVRSVSYMLNRLFFDPSGISKALNETYLQAKSFVEMYSENLTDEQKKFLLDYTRIPEYGKLKRISESYRLGVKKNGFFRQIAQLLFV